MEIYLSYYSTPLWFGFIQAWIYAFLLWNRSRQNGRLSDVLLGLVLVGMAFNIWEYMLGFSGIEILWKELNFFPRNFGYAFPPLCYFYFKSQIDKDFKFSHHHIWHFLPFIIHTLYHIFVFSMGQDFVKIVEKNFHGPFYIPEIETFTGIFLDCYYAYRALKLYQQYREWTKVQFSDTDAVSFKWFRNFLIVLVIMLIVYLLKLIIDNIYQLDFKQDWWDNLVGVALIYYVSITGYAQAQPNTGLVFKEEEHKIENVQKEKFSEDELENWKMKILTLMQYEKLYLQPELNLSDIANRLKTNISVLSGVVNNAFGKNFNDFVNEYRVKEFQERILLPENKNITLLGIAFDCGFNSKATFNRSVKKFTGKAPKDFLAV
ncbi:MAG: helix-turn-helix domain-containing protein [Bacteroidota bacterium]|jgi:AraC-like DNA-binding protein